MNVFIWALKALSYYIYWWLHRQDKNRSRWYQYTNVKHQFMVNTAYYGTRVTYRPMILYYSKILQYRCLSQAETVVYDIITAAILLSNFAFVAMKHTSQ